MNLRSKFLKLGKVLFIIFIINIFISNTGVLAKINKNYVENALTSNNDGDSNSILSIIADTVLPIILPVFTIIESLTSDIMGAVTKENFFPWADMIIYNSVPLLDINFINPSEGSFFVNLNGDETSIGITIRNVYFSALSICLGFLAISVGVNAIKLALSTIAGEKAKYKSMINKTIFTVILLFGMHYLIAFVFYLNEQLVEVASTVTQKVISKQTANGAIDVLNNASDENNEKILNNFIDDANHTSWFSPITIAKKMVKELINFFDWVGGLFSDDADDDDTVELEWDEKGNVYPSKADYIKWIKEIDHGIDVAAYMLKDYTYRDKRLWSVAGNDSNKFSQGGIWGPLTSFSNTVLWCTGLVDTGLQGLENLFQDVKFVCIEMKNSKIITSYKSYINSIDYYSDILNDSSKSEDEKTNARLCMLYIESYYRYVYDGTDKGESGLNNVVANLGTFFKRNIYYTDVDAGDWSPDKFNVIPCILYCMFILQSMMFLFSYMKRFFYVIILSLIGPVVVIFDYVMGSL